MLGSADDAVAWGRKFQQEAMFWVEEDTAFLISCSDPQLLPVENGVMVAKIVDCYIASVLTYALIIAVMLL